jgi:hypothetical protein
MITMLFVFFVTSWAMGAMLAVEGISRARPELEKQGIIAPFTDEVSFVVFWPVYMLRTRERD